MWVEKCGQEENYDRFLCTFAFFGIFLIYNSCFRSYVMVYLYKSNQS